LIENLAEKKSWGADGKLCTLERRFFFIKIPFRLLISDARQPINGSRAVDAIQEHLSDTRLFHLLAELS
jgi:hypothetical protein